jgi:hypothetical protein
MNLLSVEWTPQVNFLTVKCNCGYVFKWPASITTAQCPMCCDKKMWFEMNQKPEELEMFEYFENVKNYCGSKKNVDK